MSVCQNVSISLSSELHAVAARMLASDRYSSFSEVIRAGLRLLDEREQDFHEQSAARREAAAMPPSQGQLSA